MISVIYVIGRQCGSRQFLQVVTLELRSAEKQAASWENQAERSKGGSWVLRSWWGAGPGTQTPCSWRAWERAPLRTQKDLRFYSQSCGSH